MHGRYDNRPACPHPNPLPDHCVVPGEGVSADRRGAILILVLVCLAVATALIVGAVRLAAVSHRAAKTEGWNLQAAWLAESGLERAAARLAANPGYQGETWNVPRAHLDGRHGGTVVIEVLRPDADQPRRRSVRIRADFPDDPDFRVRHSKQVLMNLSP